MKALEWQETMVSGKYCPIRGQNDGYISLDYGNIHPNAHPQPESYILTTSNGHSHRIMA